ncbi:MAG: hypothetical protein E6R14_07285 [Thermomicrobiales bacterium]|nr:MAG: hypothetical protein E6R14_07285 [Thermomicrobiales bacterium]
MNEQRGTVLILTGEAMWPDRVNARWPGAQFEARARFDAGRTPMPDAFSTLDAPATWGVLIAVPEDTEYGDSVETTTDLGAVVVAQFDAGELLAGDPERVVGAAKYWELPWRYVGALRDAVAATGIEILDEDPRDDAVVAPAENE